MINIFQSFRFFPFQAEKVLTFSFSHFQIFTAHPFKIKNLYFNVLLSSRKKELKNFNLLPSKEKKFKFYHVSPFKHKKFNFIIIYLSNTKKSSNFLNFSSFKEVKIFLFSPFKLENV